MSHKALGSYAKDAFVQFVALHHSVPDSADWAVTGTEDEASSSACGAAMGGVVSSWAAGLRRLCCLSSLICGPAMSRIGDAGTSGRGRQRGRQRLARRVGHQFHLEVRAKGINDGRGQRPHVLPRRPVCHAQTIRPSTHQTPLCTRLQCQYSSIRYSPSILRVFEFHKLFQTTAEHTCGAGRRVQEGGNALLDLLQALVRVNGLEHFLEHQHNVVADSIALGSHDAVLERLNQPPAPESTARKGK